LEGHTRGNAADAEALAVVCTCPLFPLLWLPLFPGLLLLPPPSLASSLVPSPPPVVVVSAGGAVSPGALLPLPSPAVALHVAAAAAATAARAFTARGVVPLGAPVTVAVADAFRREPTCVGVRHGLALSISAATPATCGAAMLVPDHVA
jgi:hypothetical protein